MTQCGTKCNFWGHIIILLIDSSICEWSLVQYSGIACCERGSTRSGNDFIHLILCINKCPLGVGGLLLFYKNSINVYICGKNSSYRCMLKARKWMFSKHEKMCIHKCSSLQTQRDFLRFPESNQCYRHIDTILGLNLVLYWISFRAFDTPAICMPITATLFICKIVSKLFASVINKAIEHRL